MMEFKIVHVDETDSTNRWMKENGEGVMVVVADFQTAGKGCGSNTWESERGQNLLFSVLIHPQKVSARTQFIITQMVSVALCNTLQRYIPQTPEIKWPNDIYVGDKKICGVLIENRLEGHRIKDCVIGIGLDVNQTEFKSQSRINQTADRPRHRSRRAVGGFPRRTATRHRKQGHTPGVHEPSVPSRGTAPVRSQRQALYGHRGWHYRRRPPDAAGCQRHSTSVPI